MSDHLQRISLVNNYCCLLNSLPELIFCNAVRLRVQLQESGVPTRLQMNCLLRAYFFISPFSLFFQDDKGECAICVKVPALGSGKFEHIKVDCCSLQELEKCCKGDLRGMQTIVSNTDKFRQGSGQRVLRVFGVPEWSAEQGDHRLLRQTRGIHAGQWECTVRVCATKGGHQMWPQSDGDGMQTERVGRLLPK